jgi:hypothetical protein
MTQVAMGKFIMCHPDSLDVFSEGAYWIPLGPRFSNNNGRQTDDSAYVDTLGDHIWLAIVNGVQSLDHQSIVVLIKASLLLD